MFERKKERKRVQRREQIYREVERKREIERENERERLERERERERDRDEWITMKGYEVVKPDFVPGNHFSVRRFFKFRNPIEGFLLSICNNVKFGSLLFDIVIIHEKVIKKHTLELRVHKFKFSESKLMEEFRLRGLGGSRM